MCSAPWKVPLIWGNLAPTNINTSEAHRQSYRRAALLSIPTPVERKGPKAERLMRSPNLGLKRGRRDGLTLGASPGGGSQILASPSCPSEPPVPSELDGDALPSGGPLRRVQLRASWLSCGRWQQSRALRWSLIGRSFTSRRGVRNALVKMITEMFQCRTKWTGLRRDEWAPPGVSGWRSLRPIIRSMYGAHPDGRQLASSVDPFYYHLRQNRVGEARTRNATRLTPAHRGRTPEGQMICFDQCPDSYDERTPRTPYSY